MASRLRVMGFALATFLAASCAVSTLAGCGSGQNSPSWTPVGPSGSSAGAGPTAGGSARASASGTPSPGATSAEWKTFTDPGKAISFELPAQWIVQAGPPAAGSSSGALHFDVKKADGTFVAALQTGLPIPSQAPCDPAQAKAYSVLNSLPVSVPFTDGPDAISPRFVFRVIQGYKYFGSFGLVGVPTAAQDGKACRLRNVVPGPAGVGGYSFSDVLELAPLAPEAKVAPLQSFDTLAQASAYVEDSGDFADAQRMIMSLKFTKNS
ncbi:hypothetical protein [Sinomonas sp. ASV322]|uniref:hypothetical protein n=1 Tax=Sinomonas sp. ASV322 TaxID=3041920 RepID=UPI0027DE8069|nr:hypothetical protein [Sinomonas sp. ASV322]MDQ4502146.1 hypothetical protein [Sinomonas sp. ASV322]